MKSQNVFVILMAGNPELEHSLVLGIFNGG